MRAILVVAAALLLIGCNKEAGEDVLAKLPYWKWEHSERKDALTDVLTKSAVLKSGPLSDGNPSPVEMHFRCAAGNLDFYLSWNRFVGREHLIDTRIDSDPREPNKWQPSGDGKASFYPFLNAAFLNRLSSSKIYVARISAPSGELTAKFDTAQVQKEIKGIREECKI